VRDSLCFVLSLQRGAAVHAACWPLPSIFIEPSSRRVNSIKCRRYSMLPRKHTITDQSAVKIVFFSVV
jgi:hypothetical protein